MTYLVIYAVAVTVAASRWHVRKCRDVWPVQSVRILCAKPVDMLNGPMPAWL